MRATPLAILLSLLGLALPLSTAEVCQSASGCEFWDANYHEYTLYRVDATKIDVLILPPASPFALRDITTAKLAIQGWKDGINALGSTAFKSGVQINYYAVGQDNVPQDALADPEIVVVMAEVNPVLLFGIGYQSPFGLCAQQGGIAQALEPHEHDGAYVQQFQCQTGGYVCLALNTNFLLGGRTQMYDLVAHEFGHCLGTGHVGDALDFDAKTVPAYDVMSYMYRSSHVNCVSSLNLRSLEGIYATLLGTGTQLNPGSYYTMATSSYSQYACPQPPPGSITGG
jgi:hypothetical protein